MNTQNTTRDDTNTLMMMIVKAMWNPHHKTKHNTTKDSNFTDICVDGLSLAIEVNGAAISFKKRP
jgi:hypothetical protein